MPVRQVIVYPGEDGFWVVECPSLPGCGSQGQSREEAIVNIREAIEGYVLALKEDNLANSRGALRCLDRGGMSRLPQVSGSDV